MVALEYCPDAQGIWWRWRRGRRRYHDGARAEAQPSPFRFSSARVSSQPGLATPSALVVDSARLQVQRRNADHADRKCTRDNHLTCLNELSEGSRCIPLLFRNGEVEVLGKAAAAAEGCRSLALTRPLLTVILTRH